MAEELIAKRKRDKNVAGSFPPEVLDQLLKGVAGEGKLATAEALQGLLRQLSGAPTTRAPDAEMGDRLGKDELAAEEALCRFEDKWDARYPTVAKAWRRRWTEVIPFLAYPAEMRRAIYHRHRSLEPKLSQGNQDPRSHPN